MTAPAGLMSATEVAENIRDILAHIDAQEAEIDRLTASEKSAWNAAVTRDEEIERLRAVEREAYKRAAAECRLTQGDPATNQQYNEGCRDCAAAIEALGSEK